MAADKSHDTDDDESDDKSFYLYSKETKTVVHDVYFSTTIEPPEKYIKLFNILDKAGKSDKFIFHLSGYGGSVQSLIQFSNKLNETKAHTKAVVEAPVYSAHALFPFLCDEVDMLPGSFLMLHQASCGMGRQKMNDIEINVVSFNRLFREFVVDHCSDLLTPSEIDSILDGKDLYLFSKDVKERLAKSKEEVK